ncbi:MAG: autotransporter domain-containing protein [Parvibaculum sp.]|nr:autotransporter domain-containing protein [Parvibaculum sp.]
MLTRFRLFSSVSAIALGFAALAPAPAEASCFNFSTLTFMGPVTGDGQTVVCLGAHGPGITPQTDNGFDETFFAISGGQSLAPAPTVTPVTVSGNNSNIGIGITLDGVPDPTGSVVSTNADAISASGEFNVAIVFAHGLLEAAGGRALSAINGILAIFHDSPATQAMIAQGFGLTLEQGWALFLEGQLFATNSGTVIGDVEFTGSEESNVYNYGTLTGSITATGGGNYLVSNSGTLTGNIDLAADTASDRAGSIINNGLLTGNITMSGGSAFLGNYATGEELEEMLPLAHPPTAMDMQIDDPDTYAALVHQLGTEGAPAGAVIGEIDGGIDMSADLNWAINLGTVTGALSLSAGNVAQVARYDDGGFSGFNFLLNARGAEIGGGVSFDGGSTLLQDGLLYRSSLINLGQITGNIDIDGGSTSVINGALVPEMTSGFFSVSGAPALEEGALLRADIPPGAERGEIIGDMTFGDAGHALLNIGLIDGSVTFGAGDDIFANVGEVTGNVDLGFGNDSAIIGASSIIGGTVSGGAGANMLSIFGTGNFDPTKFFNFQTIVFDVKEGLDNIITPSGAIETSFTIAPGVTLDLSQGGTLASNEDDREIEVGGTVDGDVDLGDGQNTTFTMGEGAIVTGSINGGSSGSSVLVLNLGGEMGNHIAQFKEAKITTPGLDQPLNLTGTIIVVDTVTLVGGAVKLNGNLTVPKVSVGAGSSLGGGGTVNGSIENEGTVSPGNSIGTLNIVGNYTESGTLEIEASPRLVQNTFEADKLIVSNDITLNPGSRLLVTPETIGGITEVTTRTDWPGSATVAIVEFGGARTGTFSTVEDDFLFLVSDVTYDDANGQVLLTLEFAPVDPAVGQSSNQSGVIAAINANMGQLGGLWTVSADEIETLTGEVGTSASAIAGNNTGQFLGFLTQPGAAPGTYVMAEGSDGAVRGIGAGDAPAGSGPRVWVAPWGATGEIKGGAGTSGYDTSGYGIAAGYVASPSEGIELGLSAGYGHAEADSFGVGGSVEADSVHLAVHAGYVEGPISLTGVLAYGHHSFDQQRVTVAGGVAETVTADYKGNELSAQVVAALNAAAGKIAWRPHAGASWSTLRRDGYTETGSTLGANLTLDSETFNRGELFTGIDASTRIATSDGSLTPWLGIGGVYAFGDLDGESIARFTGTPTSFTIRGAAQDRWRFTTRAGLDAALGGGVGIGIGYAGAYGRDQTDHTLKGTVNVSF